MNLPDWSIDEAKRNLCSNDENTRLQAVNVLIRDLSYLEFIATCSSLLADPSAEIRGIVLHDICDVLRPYDWGMETELRSEQHAQEWIDRLIDLVAKLVSDPSASIAYHACEVLELMAKHSDSNIGCADLIDALGDTRKRFEMNGSPISLSDENTTVQFAAVNALGAFGPRAVPALLKLKQLCDSEDKQVRSAATSAADRIQETYAI